MRKIFIDKEELFNMFIIENMSRKEVADYFNCSDPLIKKKCKEYGIKKPRDLIVLNQITSTEKNCLNCGILFLCPFFRLKGKWERKFCCQKCSSHYRYKGEDHKQKIRNKVAAKRRAHMKMAIIPLTEEEEKRISEIYLNCPKGYEVDHVIPISKGGKHHPNNLQYLTMHENRKKYNHV